MPSSNNRFGRRAARQNDDLRAEPVLSFNTKKGAAAPRDVRGTPDPALDRRRGPQAAPRVEREDAEEFGVHTGRDSDPMPRFLRGDDGFDPKRGSDQKAFSPRVPAHERPLYHHLFEEGEQRRGGFGWMAALASVAVVAVGAVYAWHNFMARPVPPNLFDTPRGNTGYMTPAQPAGPSDSADASPSSAIPTPPATDSTPTQDIAARPEPKSVPAEAPPPPRKTISEAAANPGNLAPPKDSAAPPAPAKPAIAKAAPESPPPSKAPPSKLETTRHEDAPKQAPAPKPETAKREVPKREAAITPPRPAPPAPPQAAEPTHSAPQTAAAPVLTPPRPHRQATTRPQPLSREAPAAYPPPPSQQQAPSVATRSPPPGYAPPGAAAGNTAPPTNSPDTVTVDGVNYVNGEQPHALGTIAGAPDSGSAATPASAAPTSLQPPQAAPPAYAPPPGYAPAPAYPPRPYRPTDRDSDGGAPLPNDVIILPSGQLAVPNGR